MNIRALIINKDYDGIKQALANNPALANEGLPYDEANTTKGHPLHRICDAVFLNKLTDEEAIEIARIFLAYGADINGGERIPGKDNPLVAAASLHADKLAMFYIGHGADINHPGCHGGTALHWAAWCGRPWLVEKLVQAGADIHKLCIDFKSTPLFWAVHGLKEGDKTDLPGHLQCVKILVEAGSDKTVPNAGGKTVFDMVEEGDVELREILNG